MTGRVPSSFDCCSSSVHPCAAVLVVALEVVEVEQPEVRSVLVEHLEDAHVRLIDRQVVPFLEREAVQLVRGEEDAVREHAVQLEVRLDLVVVQVELRLAHLLGVEVPVPRLEL